MTKYKGQPITDAVAGENAIYAMLAANCYDKKDQEKFKVELLGWALQEPPREYIGGLAYHIYQHSPTGRVVLAFRGTNGVFDFLIANFAFLPFRPFNQYKQANREFKDYIEKNGHGHVTVCGHSLGGGLALSMSVRYGVPAVTFNTSPRVFDGLGNRHKPAKRVIIYEDGEILQKIRKLYPKIKEAVPEDCIYCCSYSDSGNHGMNKLAKGLIKQGVKANSELQPFVGS